MNAVLKSNVRSLVQLVERAGPYLLLELLLPGGTLFALLLFVYRNPPLRARTDAAARTPIVVARVIEGAKRIALLPHDTGSITEAGLIAAHVRIAH